MTPKTLPETCPGINKFIRPTPETINCHSCGRSLEIWSDETQTTCDDCGAQVSRENGTSCLDYCEYAAKCKDIISKKIIK